MAATTKYLVILGALVIVGGGAAYYVTHQTPTPVTAPPKAAPVATVAAPQVAPAKIAAVPTDCLYPGPAPVAPDGATSSEADMKLGEDAIQNFVLQLESYEACRDTQADHTVGATDKQKDAWIALGNQAVDEAHALANSFSTQLNIYNAAHPKK